MPLVSCHRGKLQVASSEALAAGKTRGFSTGLNAVDRLLHGEAFAYGAIHEILAEPGQGLPLFFAAMLARAAMVGEQKCASPSPGAVVWSDPQRQLYPPALAAAGIPLHRLLLLRPRTPADELWAVAECLRCKAVRATLANPQRLSQIEARRLQLAAEAGGGAGILLRVAGPNSSQYAAATRWLVRHARGEPTLQRWQLQLIHGHGGHVGNTIILEACHQTNHVRAFATVADRSPETQVARKRA